MLTCTKCEKVKEEDDFSWRSKATGKRQSWCKECRVLHDGNKYRNSPERRRKIRESNLQRNSRNCQFIWNYLLSHPCKCGETDPIVLDFDHRNPDDKITDISNMSRHGASLESLQEEIEKCNVLCANCHRRKTAVQMGWYKNIDVLPPLSFNGRMHLS